MLSKSKIVRGLQCHKSLWLYKHRYDLREVSDQQQAIFDSGTNVGLMAQQLFPNGADAQQDEPYPNFQVIKNTQAYLKMAAKVIYEATFVYNDVLVAIDILVRREDGWHGYEVKSTNSVKDPHITDAAIQYHVIKGSGIDLKDISIITFDGEYVRQGELDVHQLFKSTDVTEEVLAKQEELPLIIEELKQVQEQVSEPDIEIGPQCSDPYECDFCAYCWKEVPEYSVFNLTQARGKQWELYERGIELIEDIPFDINLSDAQQIQRDAELTSKPYINQDGITNFLQTLTYPIYHFDFETIMPAVPMFDNSRTYQQIPFQYSVHIQQQPNGDCEHCEYLAPSGGGDPREELIQAMLKDLGTEGTILAYHSSFEVSRINELARDFPQYREPLDALVPRVEDLEIPFRRKYYYTKEMQGRSSIKKVLPALIPELSYSNLEIQEGGTASSTFLTMVQGTFEGDIEGTRRALLEYCKMDTRAMVEILNDLNSKVP
ncbi:DUF2779 domain-containing protein [bacterium]|nr:DUF2779 domain-containing protein [bacterium]